MNSCARPHRQDSYAADMANEVRRVDGDPTSSGYRERNSTADRTLDILGMFSQDRLRITARQVADEFGVARSTAYRYLQTLSGEAYIEEDPDRGFRLGIKVFSLARLARQSYGLSTVAIPILRDLAAGTGETALLTRRSGNNVVCLEREESTEHLLRLSYERGSLMAVNAGASALVLLAWEDPDVLRVLLATAPLPSFTAETITDLDKLAERLTTIREQGYAVTRGELDVDALGIAAPVRDEYGRVVAGLSIVGVGRRIPEPRVVELVELVIAGAEQLGTQLALVSQ